MRLSTSSAKAGIANNITSERALANDSIPIILPRSKYNSRQYKNISISYDCERIMCLCERLMIDHPDPQTLYSLASSPIELAIIRAGPEAFPNDAKDEGTSGRRDFGQERPWEIALGLN